MKKLFLTKMATVLATLMVISMLLPVLASAVPANVWFSADVKYAHTGYVTGSVYSDADISVSGIVYLNVLDAQKNIIDSVYLNNGVAQAVYNKDKSGTYYYYDFNNLRLLNSSVLNAVYVELAPPTNVPYAITGLLQREPEPNCFNCGNGGFIGGGTVIDGSTVSAGKIELTGSKKEVSATAMKSAFNGTTTVTIVVNGDMVLLPGGSLAEILAEKPGATLVIQAKHGTLTLPLSALDYEALAEALNVDLKDLKIRVNIDPVSDAVAATIQSDVEALGGQQVSEAVDFNVSAEDGQGNSQSIDSFGDTYVSRTLPLSETTETNKTVGVVYQDGEFFSKPGTGNDDSFTIKSTSNSIYTVLTFDKSFSDIPAGHWAKEDIETLANKLVVFGMSEDTFDLNRNVTRAEFAALAVRSLGLVSDGEATPFSDVASGTWYTEDVAIANAAGIVYGYEDGTFRPNNVITRQELAAMVIRALEYAGGNATATLDQQAQILGAFTDSASVSPWAAETLAVAVDSEIVFGMGDDTLAPFSNATRAQAAAMIFRYLLNVDFIN